MVARRRSSDLCLEASGTGVWLDSAFVSQTLVSQVCEAMGDELTGSMLHRAALTGREQCRECEKQQDGDYHRQADTGHQ